MQSIDCYIYEVLNQKLPRTVYDLGTLYKVTLGVTRVMFNDEAKERGNFSFELRPQATKDLLTDYQTEGKAPFKDDLKHQVPEQVKIWGEKRKRIELFFAEPCNQFKLKPWDTKDILKWTWQN